MYTILIAALDGASKHLLHLTSFIAKIALSRHHGLASRGKENCPAKGSIQTCLSEDCPCFASYPVPATMGKPYNKRTSFEKLNSLLDVSFGLENPFIQGLQKMLFSGHRF